MPAIRILSADQVRQALSMRGAIEAMRTAFGQLAAGQAVMPPRAAVEAPGGITLVMPSLLRQSGDLAVKVVSVFPGNAQCDLPLINGAVLSLDAATGAPRALLDGASLTALRTGAVSGLATELLARDNADTVALFGAGVQARMQLLAVCTARSVRQVRVFDPVRAAAERLAEEMAGVDPVPADVLVADSPEQAVAGASIVAAATTATEPIVDGRAIEPGTHVNGVGSWRPSMREYDAELIRRAKIVVDQQAATWEEAGELIAARDAGLIDASTIHAELGEIVNGTRPGRISDEEITFFKSVGVAAQDAAAASAIVAAADRDRLGTVVEL